MIEEIYDLDGGVTDAAVMRLVGSAFDEGRSGPDPQEVLARGRQLQRRKRVGPALGVLGIVAASAGLAVVLSGPTPAGGGRTFSAEGAVVNVDNAAFSVHTDTTTGKITVAIRQYFDQDELKQVLAKAGIRTVFASQSVPADTHGTVAPCTWPGASRLDPAGVVYSAKRAGNRPNPGAPDTIVIDPAKMPSGSVLAFDYLDIPGNSGVAAALLSGEPTGCTA
jgi:hypothetical protein